MCGGYCGSVVEYVCFVMVELIDVGVVWEFVSWGVFQVMGYYWECFGYVGIDVFVVCMEDGEVQYFDVFVCYIVVDDIMCCVFCVCQWVVFVCVYNGFDYVVNLYDVKFVCVFDCYVL